jgi:hypothetical protein
MSAQPDQTGPPRPQLTDTNPHRQSFPLGRLHPHTRRLRIILFPLVLPMDCRTIVASEPDRPDRGTGSGNEVRHAIEQGSIRGTHLWYAKLDRGSRSILVWVDDPGLIEWVVIWFVGRPGKLHEENTTNMILFTRRARWKAKRPVRPAARGPARGRGCQSPAGSREQDRDPSTNRTDPLAFPTLDPGRSTRGRGTRLRSRTLQLCAGRMVVFLCLPVPAGCRSNLPVILNRSRRDLRTEHLSPLETDLQLPTMIDRLVCGSCAATCCFQAPY